VFASVSLDVVTNLGHVYGRPVPRGHRSEEEDALRISRVYAELDLLRCRRCVLGMMNDGAGESNVRFNTADLALWPTVIVTQRIAPREEILVDYGAGYWVAPCPTVVGKTRLQYATH
jgi:hypothetical protein